MKLFHRFYKDFDREMQLLLKIFFEFLLNIIKKTSISLILEAIKLIFKDFMEGKKQLNYLVHFTTQSIFKSEKYTQWMNKFGPQCRHIVLNGTGMVLPQMENIYMHQNLLNKIDTDIFPNLYPKGFFGLINQVN